MNPLLSNEDRVFSANARSIIEYGSDTIQDAGPARSPATISQLILLDIKVEIWRYLVSWRNETPCSLGSTSTRRPDFS